jgi:hypothetical protein
MPVCYLIYYIIHLTNIWSSHVRKKLIEILILVKEKKKEKLPIIIIMKKLD